MPLPVVLVDDGAGDLSPMTDLRPAFDVRTGALTLRERVGLDPGLELVGLIVPQRLEALVREQETLGVNEALPSGAVAINGQCVHVPDVAGLAPGERVEDELTGQWAASRFGAGVAARSVVEAVGKASRAGAQDVGVLSRPWRWRACRDRAILWDLELLADPALTALEPGVSVLGEHALTVAHSARVCPTAVLDVERGPIVIAPDAVVRPQAVVIGPAYVGPGSTVAEHATIRANTAIGPMCKVGGEVSGVVFQGHSNKVHDGFLGDSWVGQWVNLGAGTTNSNLLNTYAEVIVQCARGGHRERTGETFFGALIGDHVKTAIGTRIMTGAVIGTGAMVAQSAAVSGCVAPFAWLTDAGERRYRMDKFLEVARTVMGRRGVELSEAHERLLNGLDRMRA